MFPDQPMNLSELPKAQAQAIDAAKEKADRINAVLAQLSDEDRKDLFVFLVRGEEKQAMFVNLQGQLVAGADQTKRAEAFLARIGGAFVLLHMMQDVAEYARAKGCPCPRCDSFLASIPPDTRETLETAVNAKTMQVMAQPMPPETQTKS